MFAATLCLEVQGGRSAVYSCLGLSGWRISATSMSHESISPSLSPGLTTDRSLYLSTERAREREREQAREARKDKSQRERERGTNQAEELTQRLNLVAVHVACGSSVHAVPGCYDVRTRSFRCGISILCAATLAHLEECPLSYGY